MFSKVTVIGTRLTGFLRLIIITQCATTKRSQPMLHYRLCVHLAPNGRYIWKFILVDILYSHLKMDRCRSPSPLSIRTHAAAQGVSPHSWHGHRLYVPTVRGGAATCLVDVPPIHSESSQQAPRRCWRLLGPPTRDLGARFNDNKVWTAVTKFNRHEMSILTNRMKSFCKEHPL